MAQVNLTAFLPDVLPEVDGCPETVVIHHLRRAATRLCEHAPVWVVDLPKISTLAGVADYDLVGPTQGEIVRPQAVYYQDDPLAFVPVPTLDQWRPDWRTEKAPKPGYYTLTDPRTLWLIPVPDSNTSDAVTVRAQLRPARDTEEVEEFLLEDFRDTICSLALSRLLLMRGRDWYAPDLAQVHRASANGHLSRARAHANKGFSSADLTVAPQRFV